MRNQPFQNYFAPNSQERDSLIDPPARRRFRILAGVFLLPACVIFARVAWVQSELQGRYLQVLNETTEEFESIPARDGRILSESAEVFATDVNQYSVELHYRWLQQPADENWLARQVRSRLTRFEFRDQQIVSETRDQLLHERDQMWTAVMNVTGITEQEFESWRNAVQSKVTRISNAVNEKHQMSTHSTDESHSEGWVYRMATSLRRALTRAPARVAHQRIVVREEESYHTVTKNIPLEAAAAIKERPHSFPGIRIIALNRRAYPQGQLAAHIVGARTEAREDERTISSDEFPDEGWTPRIGRFGVERSYSLQLQGIPGRRRVVRDRRMRILSTKVERAPVSGRDLLLTLNVQLQKHAEQLLGEALLDREPNLLPDPAQSAKPQPIPRGGSIVVMEVATGRILAAASAPTFSLDVYTHGTKAQWDSLNSDQRFPFLSRVIQSQLPPGSVMKPFTAVAGIETGVVDPNKVFHCQGFLDSPNRQRCLIYRLYGQGHNDITLKDAIARSCNVYFFDAVRQMEFHQLRSWFSGFGLSKTTNVDLPFERSGNLPGSDQLSAEQARRFRQEKSGLAIGQSSLLVTPLQLARAIAAVANGGWLVTPHIVSPDGIARTTDDVDDRPRELARRKIRGLAENTLSLVRDGMVAAVEDPSGSAYQTVGIPEVRIAGKTGTAETGQGQDHAWFAGYVPAEQPAFAFVIVLEHGGSGSRSAGPLARQLVKKMLKLQLVSQRPAE